MIGKLGRLTRVLLRPLRHAEGTLAVIALVTVSGGVVTAAMWAYCPPTSRAEFVSEASLAATILGFAVAVIALLGTAEQYRFAIAAPDIAATWDSRNSQSFPSMVRPLGLTTSTSRR